MASSPASLKAWSFCFVVGLTASTFWVAMIEEVDKGVKVLSVLVVGDAGEPSLGLGLAIVPHQLQGWLVFTVWDGDGER